MGEFDFLEERRKNTPIETKRRVKNWADWLEIEEELCQQTDYKSVIRGAIKYLIDRYHAPKKRNPLDATGVETYIKPFLLKNGFVEVGKDKFYKEDVKCGVLITIEGYEIRTEEGEMTSNDFTIYWLIGVLTANNLIDKNYIM